MTPEVKMLAARGFRFAALPAGQKFPPPARFYLVATSDPDRLEAWSQPSGNNWAMLMGTEIAPGKWLAGVDLDVKEDRNGIESVKAMKAAGMKVPETVLVRTPSGGMHLLFCTPHPVASSVSAVAPGVDIRGVHSYLVAPGGSTADGTYVIEHDTGGLPADMPPELLERIEKAKDRPVDLPKVDPAKLDSPTALRLGSEYLRKDAPFSIQGEAGNHTAYKVACRVKDFGVSEGEALHLMLDLWNDNCDPPWNAGPDSEKADDLEIIVKSAYAHGKNPIGADNVEFEFDPVPGWEPIPKGEERKAPDEGNGVSRNRKLHGIWSSQIGLPKTDPAIVKGLLDEDSEAMLYAPYGAGKTFVALDLCHAIATGRPFCGHEVKKPGLVIYVAAEGQRSVNKRLLALRKEYGEVAPEKDRFLLVPYPLQMLRDSDLETFLAFIEDVQTRLGETARAVVLDTAARVMAGGNENSAEDIGTFVNAIGRVRMATGAAVLLVHHTGKDVSKGARGSTALGAAVDTEIELEVFEKGEGEGRMKIKKQRDGEKMVSRFYKLRPIVIGENEDGEDVVSCVVDWPEHAENEFRMEKISMSAREAMVVQIVHDSCGHGEWMKRNTLRGVLLGMAGEPGYDFPKGGEAFRKAMQRAVGGGIEKGWLDAADNGMSIRPV